MPECHACPNDGTGSKACLKCAKEDIRRWKKYGTPDTQHNNGRVHVSVDEVAGFVAAPEPVETDDASLDAAVHFIRALAALGIIEREILFSRLVGMQYPEITKRLNLVLGRKMTIQAVHWHAKRGLMDPAFAKLFRAMLVKQDRRRGLLTTSEKAASNLQNVYRLPRLLSERARLDADMADAKNRADEVRAKFREIDAHVALSEYDKGMLSADTTSEKKMNAEISDRINFLIAQIEKSLSMKKPFADELMKSAKTIAELAKSAKKVDRQIAICRIFPEISSDV